MILFCTCAYSDVIPVSCKTAALNLPEITNADIRLVPDLCGLAARRDPLLHELVSMENLCIVACHQRAVRALFAWAGVPLDSLSVRFINMRDDTLVNSTEQPSETRDLESLLPVVDRVSDWIPWFPVIDRARCVSCRQCLEFCLFGVYETDEKGIVSVVHPENCKTNCPACARLCPEAAIMFPKYGEPPINGAEITDEAAVRVAAKTVAEGNLRAALEERQKRRRALLKPEYRSDEGTPGS